MSDPEINKKFAVAKGPVNRRLVAPAPPAKDAPIVKARLAAAQARQRLGGSLADRLSGVQQRAHVKRPLEALDILMVLGATVSGVGLTLGLIQSSVWVTGISIVLLCGFGVKLYLTARTRRADSSSAPEHMAELIKRADLDNLDKTMEKLALEASQVTLDKLSNLKALITRCISMVTSIQSKQMFSNEDQLFIRECVRRYLPDSINSYFRVPQKDRATLVIEDGKTALTLLHEQMDMLTKQLMVKESHLAQMTGDSLIQQQRFLAAKTRSDR
jgi:hypothetical protein